MITPSANPIVPASLQSQPVAPTPSSRAIHEANQQALLDGLYALGAPPHLSAVVAVRIEEDTSTGDYTSGSQAKLEVSLTPNVPLTFGGLGFRTPDTPSDAYRVQISTNGGVVLADVTATPVAGEAYDGWTDAVFPSPVTLAQYVVHTVTVSLPAGASAPFEYRADPTDTYNYDKYLTDAQNTQVAHFTAHFTDDPNNDGTLSDAANTAVGLRLLIGSSAPKGVVGPLDPADLRVPHGTTAQRLALSASERGLFFDDTLGKLIGWNGSAWADVGGAAPPEFRATLTSAPFATLATLTPPVNATTLVRALVTGRSATNAGAYAVLVAVRRGASGAPTPVGSAQIQVLGETDPAWDVQATVEGNALAIQVTGGPGAPSVQWAARLETLSAGDNL